MAVRLLSDVTSEIEVDRVPCFFLSFGIAVMKFSGRQPQKRTTDEPEATDYTP
jgi:hypothetical protein